MPSDSTLEKPLPNNLDAERSVLGAVILDNNALNAAIENLKPEDFFLDQHRRVFTQMIALGESQQAIDLITLTEELHRRGDLEAAGGAPYLASLTHGLQPSELPILAPRPSQRKTALALNLAENLAIRSGQPIAVFSLEMSKESLLQRLVASVAQIDAHKFRTGHLSREDWRRMTEALGTISSSPICVDEAGSISALDIGAK